MPKKGDYVLDAALFVARSRQSDFPHLLKKFSENEFYLHGFFTEAGHHGYPCTFAQTIAFTLNLSGMLPIYQNQNNDSLEKLECFYFTKIKKFTFFLIES